MTARVHLKPGKERATLRRHPWIFSGAIASPCRPGWRDYAIRPFLDTSRAAAVA